MLGTDEAADTFQKTEIATGFGVPSVPSDQDRRESQSVAWRGTTGVLRLPKARKTWTRMRTRMISAIKNEERVKRTGNHG